MENENNVISWETYEYYMSRFGMEYENFFEKIKGKKIVCEHKIIDDGGIYFIDSLLNCDWGRSIVVTYNEKQMEFIRSRCLSDYFKEGIRELLSSVMTKEIEDILNSDKDINQMDENEIKVLYDAVHNYYSNNRGIKENVANYISSYLYKLDGKGVTSFIKNNIDGEDIARRILLTSGLNSRASYYSGRGVMHCDLNDEHLTEIFMKLLRLDEKYASNFIDMVCNMKTLGATEFINSFINLGDNKFEYSSENVDNKNVSLDDVYGGARDVVALGSIFSMMNRRDDDYQVEASNTMKLNFLSRIRKNLKDVHIKEIEKTIDNAYRDIYGSTDDYDDYELDMMVRRRWFR